MRLPAPFANRFAAFLAALLTGLLAVPATAATVTSPDGRIVSSPMPTAKECRSTASPAMASR